MKAKTKNKLVDAVYAAGFYLIMFLLVIMIIEDWSTGYHSSACQQKEDWEATGHDYVGIPYDSRSCN